MVATYFVGVPPPAQSSSALREIGMTNLKSRSLLALLRRLPPHQQISERSAAWAARSHVRPSSSIVPTVPPLSTTHLPQLALQAIRGPSPFLLLPPIA